MATEKECQCEAISLLRRMANLLNQWLENMDRAEPGLELLMNDMSKHLDAQMSLPENSKFKEYYKKRLNRIEQSIADASVGKIKFMRPVDDIRNAIHKEPIIRSIFLCEPAGLPPSPVESRVRDALEVLEVGEPLEAKAQFDKIYEELTCGA
jgi:hypothetical protein